MKDQLEEKCNALLDSKIELVGKLKIMAEQIEDHEEMNNDLRNKKLVLHFYLPSHFSFLRPHDA